MILPPKGPLSPGLDLLRGDGNEAGDALPGVEGPVDLFQEAGMSLALTPKA